MIAGNIAIAEADPRYNRLTAGAPIPFRFYVLDWLLDLGWHVLQLSNRFAQTEKASNRSREVVI